MEVVFLKLFETFNRVSFIATMLFILMYLSCRITEGEKIETYIIIKTERKLKHDNKTGVAST